MSLASSPHLPSAPHHYFSTTPSPHSPGNIVVGPGFNVSDFSAAATSIGGVLVQGLTAGHAYITNTGWACGGTAAAAAQRARAGRIVGWVLGLGN